MWFLLVIEMETFGFLIWRSLDLSLKSMIISIMWLFVIGGYRVDVYLGGKHYFESVNAARDNEAVLGGV